MILSHLREWLDVLSVHFRSHDVNLIVVPRFGGPVTKIVLQARDAENAPLGFLVSFLNFDPARYRQSVLKRKPRKRREREARVAGLMKTGNRRLDYFLTKYELQPSTNLDISAVTATEKKI